MVESAASPKWVLVAENSKQIKGTTGVASRETSFPIGLVSKNIQLAALVIPVIGEAVKSFAMLIRVRL